jgi:NAD(P)-dependent dehydrogenase (short-subunit alcohol dehydrogenase family)
MPDGSLTGHVALVTGASRGIGRAAAMALSREGVSVALVARNSTELVQAAAEVAGTGPRALAIDADLGMEGAVERILDSATANLGAPDILINNAGQVGPFGPTWTSPREGWQAALQLNLVAPYLLSRALLPAMLEKGWGRLLNVSSIVAVRPVPFLGAYGASKAALDAFTRQLAGEVAGTGVSVAAIYPGPTDTAMHAAIRAQAPDLVGADFSARFRAAYERGEVFQPDQVARLIVAVLRRGVELTGQVIDIESAQGAQLMAAG